MATAIEVENVSKRFRLSRDRDNSLKGRFIRLGRHSYEEFWALRDVDFVVAEGQTLGVLGHNGSGKSTLLKCIAGILQPTTGEIRSRGLIAALLELGAGFHPDLTGRENVYVNAALLGLTRKETDRRFDDIVAFAELEDFIDQQVKHYSSGMYIRLGFAVAINVEPDILLIDEVLAVGDEAFARKCMAKVKQFQRDGRTIVFVTHAPDMAREICDQIVVLDHAHLIANGEPGPAIRAYRDHLYTTGREHDPHGGFNDEGLAERPAPTALHASSTVRFTEVRVVRPAGTESPYLLAGEPVIVAVDYEARSTPDVIFGMAIYNESGDLLWGTNSELEGIEIGDVDGCGTVMFNFDFVPLLDGSYTLQVGVVDREGRVIDWLEGLPGFRIAQRSRATGLIALPVRIDHIRNAGVESSEQMGDTSRVWTTSTAAVPTQLP